MSKQDRTRWFSINKDGNPIRDGWYEVLYEHHEDGDEPIMRYLSDGAWYLNEKLKYTAFGYSYTKGERWRGLTQPRTDTASGRAQRTNNNEGD